MRLLKTWPRRLSWPRTEIGLAIAVGEIEPDGRGACLAGVAHHAGDGGQQLAHVDRRRVLPRQFGVEARGVGDIADQPVEPADVVLDDARQARLGLLVLGERQGLDGAAQRGQRVLQLVGDVGGETLDRVDAVVERAGHVAQRLAEMADLVAAAG